MFSAFIGPFHFLGFPFKRREFVQLELTRLGGGGGRLGDRAVLVHLSKHLEFPPNHTGLMLLKSFFLTLTCPLWGWRYH